MPADLSNIQTNVTVIYFFIPWTCFDTLQLIFPLSEAGSQKHAKMRHMVLKPAAHFKRVRYNIFKRFLPLSL